jgi:uncharacterized damage-inducible protein DinB
MQTTLISILDACAAPLTASLEGLQRTALDWRPAPDSRSIGEIVRHVIRVDNTFIERIGEVPQVADPGEADARDIADAFERQRAQVRRIAAGLDDSDASRHAAATLLHMAQHHLYHLAQIVYLRRALDRAWKAPLDAWEHATHLIGDAILMRTEIARSGGEATDHEHTGRQ